MTRLADVKAEALQLAEQVLGIHARVAALAKSLREAYDGPQWDAFLDQPVSRAGEPPDSLFLHAWLRLIADEDLASAARELRRAGSSTAADTQEDLPGSGEDDR